MYAGRGRVEKIKETWKDVVGYQGKYQVNTEGGVRRIYPSGKTRNMTPYRKKMRGSRRFVVKLTKDGKPREAILIQIMAEAFLGPCPAGCAPYHKNGAQSENHVQNIAYMDRHELGRMMGAQSRRKGVAKIDSNGETVAFYPSAREAARRNYMSCQTVTARCNGKCKSAFAPDGYAYAWEDSEMSTKQTIRKIEQELATCQRRRR